MSRSPRRHRIFVVDDEEVIAQTVAMILDISGFEARPFSDPLKALEASRLESPDLLLSDVMMPGINGVDLAIQMQHEYPKCRVLLFSGHASTQVLLERLRYGGHSFELISKPVQPSDLVRKIREKFEED